MRRKLTLPHWVVGHISKVVKGEGMPRPKQLTREQLLQGLREMMEAAEARSKARNAASRAARKRKTLHEEVRVAERNLQAFCEGRQAAEKQRGKGKRGRKVGQEPSEGDFEALEAALVASLAFTGKAEASLRGAPGRTRTQTSTLWPRNWKLPCAAGSKMRSLLRGAAGSHPTQSSSSLRSRSWALLCSRSKTPNRLEGPSDTREEAEAGQRTVRVLQHTAVTNQRYRNYGKCQGRGHQARCWAQLSCRERHAPSSLRAWVKGRQWQGHEAQSTFHETVGSSTSTDESGDSSVLMRGWTCFSEECRSFGRGYMGEASDISSSDP